MRFVCWFAHVGMLCLNRLKPMCRKESDQVFIYKPLGVLKRSAETRPTYGETNIHTLPQQVSCTVTLLHLKPVMHVQEGSSMSSYCLSFISLNCFSF